MKKRVIWHLPYAMIGGVETLYATILKYIDHNQYEHFITCHEAIEGWCREKFRGKAIVQTFSNEESLSSTIGIINPDVIMGTHGKSLYDALSYLNKVYPVIEIVHGSHIWVEHNVYMPKTWTKHVVCVSKSAQRVYEQNAKEDLPTSVIINGIDTELFRPEKALQLQSKVVGYMGRFLESDKHIKKIIKAFKSIGDHRSRLHLIGGSKVEIVHLKHFVRSLKMNNLVKFYEHSSFPEKFYKNIDVFTVRSEAEGYCNSVAEALSSGVPCVCYNFGGILEHVPKGTIAVAENQQDYARLLSEVHRNYDLRKKMRQMGLNFIQKEGNAQIMVKRYEELIAAVLEGKKLERPVEKIHSSEGTLEIEEIPVRVRHDRPVVGVCNFHWHGIATATKNICDDVVGWHRDPKQIVQRIVRLNPRAVLFSGMCPGFDMAAKLLHRNHPKFPIYAYYHGGISHYSFRSGLFGTGESEAFNKMINLHKEGVFQKIAVSYPGLAEVLRDSGAKAEFTGNLMPRISIIKQPPLTGLHLGSWNRHQDHKHTSIAVSVANLVGATLHCLNGYTEIPGVQPRRVKVYNDMPQEVLYEKYSQMTVNLHMSFIETFNISVLEMWAVGSPVIVGSGNYVLIKDHPTLKELCFVEDQTNPVAIAKQVERVANNRQVVIDAQFEHLETLKAEVKNRWEMFFT